MDIKELIEQIAASGKKYGMFYFTMENTNSPIYETAVDCRGKEVARCDYYLGLYTEKKFIHNVEDAIVYLFDADLFGWSIKSFNWCNSSPSNKVPWWELDITLFKTN